jgi:hypothetical protein
MKKNKLTKQLIKFLKKSIPLWLAVLISLDAAGAGIVITGLVMRRKIDTIQKQLIEVQDPQAIVKQATVDVLPSGGYRTSLKWGTIGKKLVESGAIDKNKYLESFKSEADGGLELDIIDGDTGKSIEINENNSRFVVNTLWALGLVNKSKVLDEGPMKTGGTDPANFASTAGWTLGSKPAMELYSSQELIPLTPAQQETVRKIAENVFRPCCGNSTAFPDCNHGMAALAYIELAVANGLSEKQIYKDLLGLNSFWFPSTYVEMAVYFKKEKNTEWKNVDPKTALSNDYSSAQGAATINKAIENVPGIKSRGGGCGA